jgi:hypothetical protein
LPQLVEQPRVLDCDYRLVSEALDQLDLLVGERTNFLAKDGDNSDQLIVLEHRLIDYGSNSAKLDGFDDRRLAFDISLGRRHIRDVDRLLGSNYIAKGRALVRASPPPCLGIRRRHIVARHHAQSASFMQKEDAESGLAESHGIRQHGLEDWLQLAR